MKTILFFLSSFTLIKSSVFAHNLENLLTQPVLASIEDLKQIKAPIWVADEITGVGFSYLTAEMQIQMQEQSHSKGKCGGFEVLPLNEVQNFSSVTNHLELLKKQYLKDQSYLRGPVQYQKILSKTSIEEAVSLVQATHLQEMVSWLSAFPSRNEKSAQKNAHVEEMKLKAEAWLKDWPGVWKTELVSHASTQQKSLKVTLSGSLRPNEIIVLGGHHDSTTSSWGGGGKAPGADDNASGSSSLLETLRILADMPQSERTIEIMWYAAEESGLLGSAEIAKAYKENKKDVVAVMQLDMTAYPGSGEMTIANITDFTSPWLQNFIKQLNEIYVGLNIVDDKCGYGCSDHASWYRQGFSTVLPFESTSRAMNPQIHTTRDVISPALSFRHAAAITQLSLAFALELANSNLRAP